MFFKGIYKQHLTGILAVLIIMCSIMAFRSAGTNESTKDETLVKSNTDNAYSPINRYAYTLIVQDDNTFVLEDAQGRIVHVFNRSYKPNKNLFNVIDRDNY